jgi:hypothetical protein
MRKMATKIMTIPVFRRMVPFLPFEFKKRIGLLPNAMGLL